MENFHVDKEPPWLLAKVDQRLAQMKAHITSDDAFKVMGADVLMVPLTEPDEHATKRQMQMWERTCDNCEKFYPGGLNVGHVKREWDGHPVLVFFGACQKCLPVPT